MLAINLILGLVFGAIVNYFGLGFCGAVKCIVNKKNTTTIRMSLISILVAGIGIYIFKLSSQSMYHMIGVMGIDIPFILGAFVFGIGMVLSDGCVLGMVRDIGKGYVYHIFTVIFMVIGTLLGNATYKGMWLGLKEKSQYIYFSDTFGNILGPIIFLVILVSVYYGMYSWCLDENDPEKNKLSKKSIIGGIVIGVYLLIYELIIKNNLGISGAFPYFGAWFVKLFGANPTSWSFFQVESSQATIDGGFFRDPISLVILGIIIGSFLISFFVTKNFEIHKIRSLKQVVLTSIGGFLMGYGICMAGSCSLAGFMTSAANLSLSGWVYLLFMALGGAAAMFVIKKLGAKGKEK